MSRETIYDLYPGSMDDQQAADADRRLYVEFFLHPMVDYLPTHGGAVSADDVERIEELRKLGCAVRKHPKEQDVMLVSKLGRPVFKEVEFIRILKPGDRDTVVERPVEDDDKLRFEKRYEDFKKNRQDAASGTPLAELPFINSAQREEYHFFNIKTAEHLAELTDAMAQRFPMGNTHREKARRFLAAAKEQGPAIAVQDALRERDQMIQDLQARLAALETSAKPQVEESPRKRSKDASEE